MAVAPPFHSITTATSCQTQAEMAAPMHKQPVVKEDVVADELQVCLIALFCSALLQKEAVSICCSLSAQSHCSLMCFSSQPCLLQDEPTEQDLDAELTAVKQRQAAISLTASGRLLSRSFGFRQSKKYLVEEPDAAQADVQDAGTQAQP